MNLKVLVIIILLSLCFFFGFKNISYYRNISKRSNISELNIIKYIPKNNKSLFISNSQSSNLIKNFTTKLDKKNQNNYFLLKDSILSYLGIDIGKNKLENIYDNELIISTYENTKENKEDILIIFKIKHGKDFNDLLNVTQKITQSDQIIPIYRENKLNFLKYIYQTKDDYIITSNNKKLILNSIDSGDNFKEEDINYPSQILAEFKNQNNILLSKKNLKSFFINNEMSPENKEDTIATIFSLKNNNLILRSYLLNYKKNININSYNVLKNRNLINKDNYQTSIFGDINNIIKYLKPVINNFEKSLLQELNQIKNQNFLLLSSGQDWIIASDNNNQNKLKINDITKLRDFNKYSLEKNENIYSIYSKVILKEDEDDIQKYSYEDIFTIDSSKLFLFSNRLIESKDLDLLSRKFFDLKDNRCENDFLYEIADIKGINPFNPKFILNLEELNFLLRNIIKIHNTEAIEIVKQSIPDRNPTFYSESSLQFF